MSLNDWEFLYTVNSQGWTIYVISLCPSNCQTSTILFVQDCLCFIILLFTLVHYVTEHSVMHHFPLQLFLSAPGSKPFLCDICDKCYFVTFCTSEWALNLFFNTPLPIHWCGMCHIESNAGCLVVLPQFWVMQHIICLPRFPSLQRLRFSRA